MIKSMRHCWTIVEHAIMQDKRNGGTMMRVTFKNLATQITADTYICPANRNARNWTEVLQNLNLGLVISNLDIVKRSGKMVISADSHPVVDWSGDKKKLEENLNKIWRPQNNFGDLFE